MAESRITAALEDGEARNPIHGLFDDLEVRSLDEIAAQVKDRLGVDLSRNIAIARNKAEDLEDDFPSLSEDERAILTLYTMEDAKKERSFYYQINECLRARDRERIKPWRDAIWLLLTAMKKLPRCKSTTLYRGVKKMASELGKQCKVNKTFLWCGFTSTAQKSEGVKDFLGTAGPRTLWHLELRKDFFGVSLEPFSLFPSEYEVLLPPQLNFKVISMLDCGNELTMVQCQQVEELDPIMDFMQGPDAGPSPVLTAAAAKAKGYPTAPQAKGPNVSPSPVPTAPAAKAKGYPTPSTPAQDSGGDGLQELLRPRALTTTIEHAHDGQWVMAICPVDGEMFATAGNDSALRLWRLGATGPEAVRAMKGHGNTVLAVAKVSPEVICTGSVDETAKLWEVSSGRSLATLQGHAGNVSAVAVLGPELLATGSWDGTVKLWQLPGGTCSATLRGHEDYVQCLAAVTPQLLVSGSSDDTVRLWDAAKAQGLGTWRGHEGTVYALAALGGSTVASGSGDNTVKTWDVATGSNVLTLRGHGGTVWALQVLNPQVIASGSADKSVRIWDLRSGKCAQVLQGHTGSVRGLALMGKVLLSCGEDGTIRAWT